MKTDKLSIPDSDVLKGIPNIEILKFDEQRHIFTSLSLVSYKKVTNIKVSFKAKKAQF